jgi:hypothetical protein
MLNSLLYAKSFNRPFCKRRNVGPSRFPRLRSFFAAKKRACTDALMMMMIVVSYHSQSTTKQRLHSQAATGTEQRQQALKQKALSLQIPRTLHLKIRVLLPTASRESF